MTKADEVNPIEQVQCTKVTTRGAAGATDELKGALARTLFQVLQFAQQTAGQRTWPSSWLSVYYSRDRKEKQLQIKSSFY